MFICSGVVSCMETDNVKNPTFRGPLGAGEVRSKPHLRTHTGPFNSHSTDFLQQNCVAEIPHECYKTRTGGRANHTHKAISF